MKKENKTRSLTLMFGKNHSEPVKVLCSIWNHDKNQGDFFIEENDMQSAYLPPKYLEIKKFTNREELDKYANDKYQEIGAKNQVKQNDRPFESEKTFYITLYGENRADSLKCDSSPINILEDDGKILVTLLQQGKFKHKKGTAFFIDVTNDPTNACAGGTVSLGYYTWRITMKYPVIINENPIQIACLKKNYTIRKNRSTRRVI